MANFLNLGKREIKEKEIKEKGKDGLFRPYPTKDGDIYKATIRFLPHLSKETGELVEGDEGYFINKRTYFITFPNDQNYTGVYDMSSNDLFKCPLASTIYNLSKKAKDLTDPANGIASAMYTEHLKNQPGKENYYSYIYVVDDKTNPENNGKLFVFQYGKQIKDKIDLQLKDKGIDVFDPLHGKDFELYVTTKTLNGNVVPVYDNCNFESQSVMSIFDPEKNKMRKLKVTKDEDDNIVELDKRDNELLNNLLLNRNIELNSFRRKEWDEATVEKVNYIIKYFNRTSNNQSTQTTKTQVMSDDDDLPFKTSTKTSKKKMDDMDDIDSDLADYLNTEDED